MLLEATPLHVVLNGQPDRGIGLASLLEEARPPFVGTQDDRSGTRGSQHLDPPLGVAAFQQTRLRLQAMGERTVAALPAPAEAFRLDETLLIRWVHYTLTVVIAQSSSETTLRWSLEPGGDDSTARADSLDLLAALHQPGWLEVLPVTDGDALMRVPLLGDKPMDADLEEAREIVNLFATLEEWTGRDLAMPDVLSAQDRTRAEELVLMIRNRTARLRIEPELTATVVRVPDALDDVRLPVHLDVAFLGHRLPLGHCLVRLPLDPASASARADGGFDLAVAVERPDDHITADVPLDPPPSRRRNLRRTLVAGAPPPFGAELVLDRVDALRRLYLDDWLREREEERGGPISDEARAQVAQLWD